MKTTCELPDHLVRELKLYAVNEQRTFKDITAELLTEALMARLTQPKPSAERADSPFPLYRSRASTPPAASMSIDELIAMQHSTLEALDYLPSPRPR